MRLYRRILSDVDTKQLAAVPLFSMLEDERVQWLAEQCPPRDVIKGAILAHVGDPARHLIVLERGILSAICDTGYGSRVRFATATGPCVIDKAAVLEGGVHTATWTALADCRIRFLPVALLRGLIDDVPALREHILRHLSGQVNRDRLARVRHATSRPVVRIADWVTESMRTQGRRITLPGAQQGLGEEIGLSRVTVNRALHVLAEAGAIRIEPGVIVVLDPGRLAAAATSTGH